MTFDKIQIFHRLLFAVQADGKGIARGRHVACSAPGTRECAVERPLGPVASGGAAIPGCLVEGTAVRTPEGRYLDGAAVAQEAHRSL